MIFKNKYIIYVISCSRLGFQALFSFALANVGAMANPFDDFVKACAAAPSHWAVGTLHGEASGGETAAADLDPTAVFFSSLSSNAT